MASPPSPTSPTTGRKRASSVAQSITSVSRSVTEVVMQHDPPPGFFAATAQATSKAPGIGDIRRGSFGKDGWQGGRNRSSSNPNDAEERRLSAHGATEMFATVTEESAYGSASATPDGTQALQFERKALTLRTYDAPTTETVKERTDHDRIASVNDDEPATSSADTTPPKQPWTTSTLIGLKAFWKWFTTPFGFLVTLYGLNVVAWGGMLFLLLCNASPAMCHAPVPRPSNQRHVSPAAALNFPGPYYFNCNDINSPRRIWIEIDSQILNALFCVTGLGLVPWRFRDLYYLLRWRFTSEKKHGREEKMYGLRVLAGIYRGWFRLPGSETLDSLSAEEYTYQLDAAKQPAHNNNDNLEAAHSALSSLPENDPRVPLPLAKRPAGPTTGIRASPTKLWKLDFFIWCFCWNTFFQCCLCGFMWGMNRYARPPWSTGLFVALACIIAGVGGIMSWQEGKRIKKIEGVAPVADPEAEKVIGGNLGESGAVEGAIANNRLL